MSNQDDNAIQPPTQDKPFVRALPSRINNPEYEGCYAIGDLVAAIAKNAIMDAYRDGVITDQEAIDLIAFAGLKHS